MPMWGCARPRRESVFTRAHVAERSLTLDSLFTSESVTEGHPDKMADRISDSVLDAIMADEKLMEEWIREGVQGDWHACCTNRMGRPDDRMSVVDKHGRVHGFQGLRVIDASIMPSVPCANTNISTIMIGEKMSDHILNG